MSIIDDKWELLFERYRIEREVSESGIFYITADQIREYKEPRLMTKFDTRESLPAVFGKKLGILPVTRGSYCIGAFDLYADFPEENGAITRMEGAGIPSYLETVDLRDIRSEAAAINVLGISGILEDFLGEPGLLQTVSGRMGSGSFDFSVSSVCRSRTDRIQVANSQVEIDGGFENRNIFAVLEGKNVVHSNFLIRQLYYPVRLWSGKIRKPVKPVFMVYSNNIFRLLEYEFTDLQHYNSIRLVREKNYSLEDTKIYREDLAAVWQQVRVLPECGVTFIQADSFDKVISLTENLKDTPMTAAEIAELFGFRERQSDYYYNALRYLGLAEKCRGTDGITRVFITERGLALLNLDYKKRQLGYVRLILEHPVFYELFDIMLRTDRVPDRDFIISCMRRHRVCGENLLHRRSSSVSGWLRWIWRLCV